MKLRIRQRRRDYVSLYGPIYWHVQRLAGYTDGRPSWTLDTMRKFHSKAEAEAYVQQRLSSPGDGSC